MQEKLFADMNVDELYEKASEHYKQKYRDAQIKKEGRHRNQAFSKNLVSEPTR